MVDTLDLLLAATDTAASVQDRDAAAEVVAQACNERARRLIAHHDRSNWAPLAWVRLV